MEQVDLWNGFYRANGVAWRGNSRIPDPLGGRGSALDLGCGNGKTVSSLLDLGYDVTGVDFSEEAVSMCRDGFDSGRFEVSDILELPFEDSSFDYVTAVHVLEHVEEDEPPAPEQPAQSGGGRSDRCAFLRYAQWMEGFLFRPFLCCRH